LLSGANASAPPFSFFLEMVNPNLRFLCGAVPSSSWAGKNAFGEVRAMSLEYDISENTSKVPALDQDKLKVYKVTLITGDIATPSVAADGKKNFAMTQAIGITGRTSHLP